MALDSTRHSYSTTQFSIAGATGNVATEDVLYLMQGLGIETGIDLAQVVAAGEFISNAIGRANASRAGRALIAKAQSASAPSCA